jgi:signal transduction histidine kinase
MASFATTPAPGEMTAEDWSEHDLDRRPHDEIGRLAATLDRLLDRIAASRRHERRFAADVAHELRTPLAAIRARVDLSLDPRASAVDHAAALGSVGAQAGRMTATVDAGSPSPGPKPTRSRGESI